MVIVGLTGGVGSGKTTMSKRFKTFGVPVYIADDEAKALMNRSKVIKRKLIELFGESAYRDGKLNRPFLASKIFTEKELTGVQLFSDKAWKSDFVQDYKIQGIPRFILIDPKGNIVNPDAPRPSSPALIELFNSLNI